MAAPLNKFQRYLRFSTVGLELGLSVMVGLFVGQWLDKKLGTHDILTLVGLLFGAAAGFRSVYRLLKQLNQEQKDDAP